MLLDPILNTSNDLTPGFPRSRLSFPILSMVYINFLSVPRKEKNDDEMLSDLQLSLLKNMGKTNVGQINLCIHWARKILLYIRQDTLK